MYKIKKLVYAYLFAHLNTKLSGPKYLVDSPCTFRHDINDYLNIVPGHPVLESYLLNV